MNEEQRARRRATATMWVVLGVLALYVLLTVLYLHG